MCIVQRNISSITNLVTRCQLMKADPSLGAPRDLVTRDHRFTVIPGGVGSATRNPDSRFNRFCQILIKIQDSSQDLKDFKSLEILSLLAVNTKILQVSYKI